VARGGRLIFDNLTTYCTQHATKKREIELRRVRMRLRRASFFGSMRL
jgi:hypothetical protein